MCALYGDDENWGSINRNVLEAGISGTDVIVQPRQSNTWGPISLDHVYEFAGALSLAAKSIGGKEPDAVMVDYRNSYIPRLQDAKEAIAVETRTTILNPDFIKERMKGDATTAQMFGEIFRNIFGWSATRPSALNDKIYDDLYNVYIEDVHGLGVKDYFERVNPAALQEMTATMMESARKGFWNPTDRQLSAIASLHADVTAEHGAPCTEFVCGNKKLQEYISSRLDSQNAERYEKEIAEALAENSGSKRLRAETKGFMSDKIDESTADYIAVVIVAVLLIIVVLAITVRRKERK